MKNLFKQICFLITVIFLATALNFAQGGQWTLVDVRSAIQKDASYTPAEWSGRENSVIGVKQYKTINSEGELVINSAFSWQGIPKVMRPGEPIKVKVILNQRVNTETGYGSWIKIYYGEAGGVESDGPDVELGWRDGGKSKSVEGILQVGNRTENPFVIRVYCKIAGDNYQVFYTYKFSKIGADKKVGDDPNKPPATESTGNPAYGERILTILRGHAFVAKNFYDKDFDENNPSSWIELHRGDKIKLNDFFAIRTPPDTRATVTYPDGSVFTVKSNSFARFYTEFINMTYGEIHFSVQKTGKLGFTVVTPSSVAGSSEANKRFSLNSNPYKILPASFVSVVPVTEFVVKVESDGTTTCLVLNGAIDVSDTKKRKIVHLLQNQSSVIKIGSLPSTPTAFNQNTIDRWWEKDESPSVNLTTANKSKLLDTVLPGSLAKWSGIYNPLDKNPKFSAEEISLGDGSTAIRTRAVGNTLASCENKWIRRIYETGLLNSNNTVLEVTADFWFNGTTYNAPSIGVELFDANGGSLGHKVFFGKNVIGSFNRSQVQSNGSIELNSDKGLHRISLNQIGANIKFSKLVVYLMNYACQGENSIIFKRLEIKAN